MAKLIGNKPNQVPTNGDLGKLAFLDEITAGAASATEGSATAWVNWDGTGTVAIRDSFNVSSITDNGTADYTINFTTPMDHTDYVPTMSTRGGTSASGGSVAGPLTDVPTTTTFRVRSTSATGTNTDNAYCFMVFHGGMN